MPFPLSLSAAAVSNSEMAITNHDVTVFGLTRAGMGFWRSHAETGAGKRAGRLSQIGVARFARKYPAVMDALLRALLELICKYHRTVLG